MRGGGSRRPKAPAQSLPPGRQPCPVKATSRPPGGSRAKAARTWRRSAPRRLRSTPGVVENGGFMSTTEGRTWGMQSPMASALWRVTDASGNSPSSIPARTAASSLRCSAPAARDPSAHSASTASIPVPAEGSSTTSPGRTRAAWSTA